MSSSTPAPANFAPRSVRPVLGAPIDVVSPTHALQRMASWAQRRESRVVCVCNVHSVVTAARDPAFMRVLVDADLATPDGAPVAWMLRRQGARGQARVTGPELMEAYCDIAAARGESIFLYGSTEDTLRRLQDRLAARWPTLRVAGSISPPFRPLTAEEDQSIVQTINNSGAGTVWVSLGCPKQEQWMAAHHGRVHAVMVGVGAAFSFHAGTASRAPPWMQRYGLEWLHRLLNEPRRLWRRYLTTNTVFLVEAARQLLTRR